MLFRKGPFLKLRLEALKMPLFQILAPRIYKHLHPFLSEFWNMDAYHH